MNIHFMLHSLTSLLQFISFRKLMNSGTLQDVLLKNDFDLKPYCSVLLLIFFHGLIVGLFTYINVFIN